MKKIIASIMIMFMLVNLSSICYAEKTLAEIDKNDIIYGPDSLIYDEALKKEIKFQSYLFSGDNMSALSLSNGVVDKITYVFYSKFTRYWGFDSYEEGKNSLSKNGVDSKYLTMQINIKINDTDYISYVGLNIDSLAVKQGQKINVGDYLGEIGYGVKKIDQKNLFVEHYKNDKLADISQIFDIKNPYKSQGKSSADNESSDQKAIDYRNDVMKVEDLQKTFLIFKQAITELHPNLYAYIDKDELNRTLTEIENNLNEPITRNALFIELSKVIRLIKDNHTYLIKPYLSNESLNYTIPYDLPVKIGYVSGKWYVLDVYDEGCNLKKGEEVIAINDESMSKVYEKLIALAGVADGNNKGFSETFLLNESAAFASGFKYLYDMAYQPNKGDLFKIKTKRQEISVNLKKYSLPKKTKKEFKHVDKEEIDNTLVLKINTMSLKEEHLKFIEQALKTDKQNILIDLRKNFGGNADSIGEIYKWLTDKQFRVFKSFELKDARQSEAKKYVMNIILDDIFYDDYVLDDDAKMYYADQETNPKLFNQYEPNNLCVDKNIYVLTSEITGSSACILTNLIKDNGIGKVLGREGSGSYATKCGVKFARINLGKSGLILQVPLVKISEDINLTKGHGLAPDYYIPNTIEEALDEDKTLTEALKYVNNARESKLSYVVILAVILVVLVIAIIILRYKTNKKVKG